MVLKISSRMNKQMNHQKIEGETNVREEHCEI